MASSFNSISIVLLSVLIVGFSNSISLITLSVSVLGNSSLLDFDLTLDLDVDLDVELQFCLIKSLNLVLLNNNLNIVSI